MDRRRLGGRPRGHPRAAVTAAGALAAVVLLGLGPPARAEIVFYTDPVAWLGDLDPSTLRGLVTDAAGVALADEVPSPPGTNEQLCDGLATCQLTFRGSSTGFPWDFVLRPLEPGAGLTFDDTETGPSAPFEDALSIGDVNDFEDDDFEVTFSGASVYAFALFIRDNTSLSGEAAVVNAQAESATLGGGVNGFLGVISTSPLVRFRYLEDGGGDDIAVSDFFFATRIRTDLRVVKSGPAVATPGLSLSYQIEVRNLWPRFTVDGARVVDDFPGPLTCSWTCAPIAASAACESASGSGSWTVSE